jgi:hypothetical protein
MISGDGLDPLDAIAAVLAAAPNLAPDIAEGLRRAEIEIADARAEVYPPRPLACGETILLTGEIVDLPRAWRRALERRSESGGDIRVVLYEELRAYEDSCRAAGIVPELVEEVLADAS